LRSPNFKGSRRPQNIEARKEISRVFFRSGTRITPAAVRELRPLKIIIGRNGRWKMDDLKNRASPDRSKINMHEPYEVKYLTKELGVNRDQLQKLIDKVGNSAASVRKELAT
jgi:hypothetical protein